MLARSWLSVGLLYVFIGFPAAVSAVQNRFSESDTWADAGEIGDGVLQVPTRTEDGKTVYASYRVQSFASKDTPTDVTLRMQSEPGALVSVRIEGPFKDGDAADAVPPGKGPEAFAALEGENFKRDLRLLSAGVYRILPRSTEASKKMFLSLQCSKNCSRPVMTLTDIRKSLHAKHGDKREALVRMLQLGVEKLAGKNEVWGKKVAERLATDLNSEAPVRDIVMPEVSRLSELLPALDGLENDPLRGNPVDYGELKALLGPCDFDRNDEGKPIHPSLPGVKFGHYNSQTLTRCELSHSVRLARILTALAINKPGEKISVVKLPNGVDATSAKQVMEYLIETGHHIELRHERTYANFLSLKLPDNKESRIPFLLDTGIKLDDGKPLVVPMGHSQAMWRIWGPQVNARVAFFLGISGAGFYSQIDSRPAWTGSRRLRSYVSNEAKGVREILEATHYAELYLRRNRLERAELPADGYAILGVCNDSTAIVERQKPRPFPLLRRSDYNSKDLGDGLNPLLASLPHDTDIVTGDLNGAALESRRKSIFCRVLNMSPHAPESVDVWDESLRAGLKAAAKIAPHCF